MSETKLSESITDILSIARLAPSVHNTQPWQVRITGNQLKVEFAKNRLLADGDPTKRQAYISLGIFTEALLIALTHCGFSYDEPAVNGDITIGLKKALKVVNKEDDLVRALHARFTDRTIYKKVEVDNNALSSIENSYTSTNVKIICKTEEKYIDLVAKLTKQALLLAFSNPSFRAELTDHFVSDKKNPVGIPLSTLAISKPKTFLIKHLIRSGLNSNKEADTEFKRWKSSSLLVFILAGGDSPKYWVESGRAYMRASLAIEKLGLNQATSAALVEAADFHEDIEKALGTKERLQCLIRAGMGVGNKKAASGRLKSEDLLAH